MKLEEKIKKYLNRKGQYCLLKSENVRENYKFERSIQRKLQRKHQTEGNCEKLMTSLLSEQES